MHAEKESAGPKIVGSVRRFLNWIIATTLISFILLAFTIVVLERLTDRPITKELLNEYMNLLGDTITIFVLYAFMIVMTIYILGIMLIKAIEVIVKQVNQYLDKQQTLANHTIVSEGYRTYSFEDYLIYLKLRKIGWFTNYSIIFTFSFILMIMATLTGLISLESAAGGPLLALGFGQFLIVLLINNNYRREIDVEETKQKFYKLCKKEVEYIKEKGGDNSE